MNFRDEKTLLGVGQAQVRAESSVESAPALTVALLPLSAQRAFGNSAEGLLPQPKWAASSKGPRTSTQQLIHQVRAEVWGRGLGIDSFSGFAPNLPTAPSLRNALFLSHPPSAMPMQRCVFASESTTVLSTVTYVQ